MLQRLYIENYVLIERLDLNLESGLTVITGETGAGKSILLGALSLILGQRAETRMIKDGSSKCFVEAEFDISSNNLEQFFKENDLEYVANSCLLRREIYSNGKSRAFVNDSPVSLNVLKDLTSQLIDIHSQHQNLLLGDERFQMNVVDAAADNQGDMEGFRNSFQKFRELQQHLKRLMEQASKSREEEDYLRYQFDQLKSANLKNGEQVELEEEWETLTHAEEIKSGLGKIFTILDNEEGGVNQNLKQALNQAENLSKLFPKYKEKIERLRSCFIDLSDLSSETEVLLNDVEVDPERMEQVNEKLNLIYGLEQKHHKSDIEGLIALRDELAAKFQKIESFDEDIALLNKELAESEKVSIKKAEILSATRDKAIKPLEKKLTDMLHKLGMPKARLMISKENKTIDEYGSDNINFMFSANGDAKLQPIENIASGGEMSRIMLCIKSVLAEKMSLSTLIFDEIDTGVSGEIAYKMGEIMLGISRNRQVICITHLPQIAAKGDQHFKVQKTEQKNQTVTIVMKLDQNERLMEIAQMLSGANVTDAALANANSLLQENS